MPVLEGIPETPQPHTMLDIMRQRLQGFHYYRLDQSGSGEVLDVNWAEIQGLDTPEFGLFMTRQMLGWAAATSWQDRIQDPVSEAENGVELAHGALKHARKTLLHEGNPISVLGALGASAYVAAYFKPELARRVEDPRKLAREPQEQKVYRMAWNGLRLIEGVLESSGNRRQFVTDWKKLRDDEYRITTLQRTLKIPRAEGLRNGYTNQQLLNVAAGLIAAIKNLDYTAVGFRQEVASACEGKLLLPNQS